MSGKISDSPILSNEKAFKLTPPHFMYVVILYNFHFSAYKEDNQLGSFLEEIRKVFKGELEHQTTLASNEERIKDIENDAADAMEDNPNSVSNTISAMIKFF